MRYCFMYGFAAIEAATIARPAAATGTGLLRLRRAWVHAADLLAAARPPDELLADVTGRDDAHDDGGALLDLAVREQCELRLARGLLHALTGMLATGQGDRRVLGETRHLQRRHAPAL